MESKFQERDTKTGMDTYDIKANYVGSIGDYLEILKDMVTLYDKQYELLVKRRKSDSRMTLGFMFSMITILFNVYLVENRIMATYWLSVAVIIVYFNYNRKTRVKVQKRENKLNNTLKGIGEDSSYPKFYYTGYWLDSLLNIAKYQELERVFHIIGGQIGECEVYKLNTPIINNTDIPEGMKVVEKYLFEIEDEIYQVAYEEGKDEGSIMLITLEGNPVKISGKEFNQYI